MSALVRDTYKIIKISVPKTPRSHTGILAIVLTHHNVHDYLVAWHAHILSLASQTVGQVSCQCATGLVIVSVRIITLWSLFKKRDINICLYVNNANYQLVVGFTTRYKPDLLLWAALIGNISSPIPAPLTLWIPCISQHAPTSLTFPIFQSLQSLKFISKSLTFFINQNFSRSNSLTMCYTIPIVSSLIISMHILIISGIFYPLGRIWVNPAWA